MRPRRISTVADPALADYQSLTDVALRRRIEPAGGFFMAESAKVIERAVAAGYQPRSILISDRWLPTLEDIVGDSDVTVLVADDDLIRQVAGYHVHRGALASMHRKPLPSLTHIMRGARRLAVLEGIVDHTNVGAAFRSIAALGFDGVVIDPTCADPLYRRAVRVSMGAVLTLPWTRTSTWPDPLQMIEDEGFTTVALTPDPESLPLHEVAANPPAKVALLLGSEGHGLSPDARAASRLAVRIPMDGGIDSLNVAAATAVACYAFATPGPKSDHSVADELGPEVSG
jgi:tRNA G18 (ribose-2'-O)-methylase SpoU